VKKMHSSGGAGAEPLDPTSANINAATPGNVDEVGGDPQRSSTNDADLGSGDGKDVEEGKSALATESAKAQLDKDADEKGEL
jgi:hypothetical protein